MELEPEWETRFTKLVREAETNIVKIFRKHLPTRRPVPGTAMEITSTAETKSDIYRRSCLESPWNFGDRSVKVDSMSRVRRLGVKARDDSRQNDINQYKNGTETSDPDNNPDNSALERFREEETARLRLELAELRREGEEREKRLCALESEKEGLLSRLERLEAQVGKVRQHTCGATCGKTFCECQSIQKAGSRVFRWEQGSEEKSVLGVAGGQQPTANGGLTRQVQELKDQVDVLQGKVQAALDTKQTGVDSDSELGPMLDDHYGSAGSQLNKEVQPPSASSVSKDVLEGDLEEWDSTDELSLEELNLSYTDEESSGSLVN